MQKSLDLDDLGEWRRAEVEEMPQAVESELSWDNNHMHVSFGDLRGRSFLWPQMSNNT